MNEPAFELSAAELAETFEQDIAPLLRASMSPSERPELIVLGGQPASGKTMAVRRLERDERFAHEQFFAPEGDSLRPWHPDYEQVMADDPLRMPDVTKQASGAWLSMAVDLGFELHASMLIEGTWRDYRVPVSTLEQGREAGYRTHAVLVAVPPQVSRIDMLDRYYEPVRNGQPARWTPPAAHDEAVAKLEATAVLLADSALVDTFSIVTRDGTFVIDQEPRSPRRAEHVLTGLREAREAYWNPTTHRAWRDLVATNHAAHQVHTAGRPAADAVWEQILTRDVPHIPQLLTPTTAPRASLRENLETLKATQSDHAQLAEPQPRAYRPDRLR